MSIASKFCWALVGFAEFLIIATLDVFKWAARVVFGVIGLFCILWATAIIFNDVHGEVSLLHDKWLLALLLAIGVVTLLEVFQPRRPPVIIMTTLQTIVDRIGFPYGNYKYLRDAREACNFSDDEILRAASSYEMRKRQSMPMPYDWQSSQN